MTRASMLCFEMWRCLRRCRGARVARHLCLALCALAIAPCAWSHKASDAYLQVHVQNDGLTIRWDIALRDLDNVIELDGNGDRRLTWGEVRAAMSQIEALAVSRLEAAGCPLRVVDRGLERRNDGAYVALSLTSRCHPVTPLALRYTLFAGVDATHRGIAHIVYADGREELRLLDPARPEAVSRSVNGAPDSAGEHNTSAAGAATSFLIDGVHHILSGYDHLLFLLCLLVPAVLRRTATGWQPVAGVQQALRPVARVVTLFTLAHSITLALAATGLVELSPSFIEPAIAVTIIVAAVDNLWPIFGRWRGAVTFAFGLIHGFGFAGVLRELQLPARAFAWALLRFNLGIELGQLAVVALVVPVLFLQRRHDAYPRWALRAGSLSAAAVAAAWVVERVADVSLFASVRAALESALALA